ncbi:sulfotransferase family protein [Hymenobacter persicinus]|uniref:Sulfotransferase family protein n=1 Tax=Hymenobacter persicinus TaxID=2025506 RepID=A0A4Q5LGK3_9BACT|nr:sulfotransferase family protein [Hymenobacter persicinus]RYU83251.1 sulfotransferase family protein [Hymenobacter persicinus]
MSTTPPSTPAAASLGQQFPYRLQKANPLLCEWLTNTADTFTEPFFDQTLTRLRAAPVNQQPFKGAAHVDLLPEWAARGGPGRAPTAIIFHVSRCGSTLFSQLLALQPQHLVLSEVPFFDELLRLPLSCPAVTPAAAGRLFHAALQLYAGSAPHIPEHVFVKADSWHLHFYEQLRQLYPTVPFVLLYRNPWEVLQSQQRRRSVQAVPGMLEPALFGFGPEQAAEYDLDRHMANVLHSYLKKMLTVVGSDPHSILLNYSEGAEAGLRKIVAATGIPFPDHYARQVAERAGFHAKYPGQAFQEADNQEESPAFLAPTMALYNQLEALRQRAALAE